VLPLPPPIRSLATGLSGGVLILLYLHNGAVRRTVNVLAEIAWLYLVTGARG
jgi:hypothetical protein